MVLLEGCQGNRTGKREEMIKEEEEEEETVMTLQTKNEHQGITNGSNDRIVMKKAPPHLPRRR